MRLRLHARTKSSAVIVAVAAVLTAARWSAGVVPSEPQAEAVAAPKAARGQSGHQRWLGGERRRPAPRVASAAPKRGRRGDGSRLFKVVSLRRPRTAIEIVLAAAHAQLGKRYVYGAEGPNTFDCSGLTKFVWAQAGVVLPHNAAAQWSATQRVPLEDMRPGDLVFASNLGHVGLYIGGGRMIHAPRSGERVKISPLHANTVGAGRVVMNSPPTTAKAR